MHCNIAIHCNKIPYIARTENCKLCNRPLSQCSLQQLNVLMCADASACTKMLQRVLLSEEEAYIICMARVTKEKRICGLPEPGPMGFFHIQSRFKPIFQKGLFLYLMHLSKGTG